MATKQDQTQARKMTPMEEEQERRRLAVPQGEELPPVSEVHTWPDGSQAVGVAPFPDKSPLEREAEQKRAHAAAHGAAPAVGMHIPQGMRTSGAPAPSPAGNVTESQFKAKVEQQLQSDMAAGKDPNTPNPTTSSDKPELANITAVDTKTAKEVISGEPTTDELRKAAAGIKPTGELVKDASKAEVEAAVTQVAREIKGPVVADTDDKASQK